MKNIIDTAVDAGKFTTLVDLLKAASFCDTLRTTGPYTLFAPTDDAFKSLAPGALDALVRDRDGLYAVLAYHVACGTITCKDMTSREIRTVAGTSLAVTLQDGNAFVNGARIVQADISASNGVIHMVHAVLMPPETRLAAG
jgi:uncharacterized surface protein with fasciclin (FAS1) repeats